MAPRTESAVVSVSAVLDEETAVERYNDFFATEAEARLGWALYNLARYGLGRPIPPFPGDQLPAPRNSAWAGGGIFDTLRQVDLYEWASKFTELRPAGPGRWKGLCPLHQEKTASFHVYSDPWRWRCYGACAQGGDITVLARELKQRGRR